MRNLVREQTWIAFLIDCAGVVCVDATALRQGLDELVTGLFDLEEESCTFKDCLTANDLPDGIRQTKGLPQMPSLSHTPLMGEAVCPDSAQSQPALDYIASLDSANSRRAMRVKLDMIARLMGYASIEVTPWSELTTRTITQIREHLIAYGRSPATVNQTITALKGVVRHAWIAGLVADHTLLTLRLVKKVRGTRDPAGRSLAQEECERLFASCDAEDSALGKRDAAFFALGLGLGLRRSEIVTVKIADLRESDHTLLVRGKGNVERRMPVPEAVWERLVAWMALRGIDGSPFIITHAAHPKKGIALTRFSSTAIVRSRLKKACLAYFSCHDLRRTYATALYGIDHDILSVKEGLGHASVTTTQKYIHGDKTRLKELTSKLLLGVKADFKGK